MLRRQLASELRRLRDAAGLTSKQASDHLFCTPSKISRIETGRVTASPRDVRDLLELYGANGQQREDFLRLAHEARQKETRLILRAIFPNLPHERIERLVELRMTRQSLLKVDDPPTLEVVLDEAALHCPVSDRRVRERQLHRLIEAVGMPNVAFQLLAYRIGPHDGMAGPFTILSFVDPTDPGVVHLEHSTGEVHLDRADQVDRYRAKFQHLQALACTPDESTAFLVDLVKEL